jgi:hypothetical protein
MPTTISGWPVLDNPPWGDPRAITKKIPEVGTALWVRKECWPFFAALVRDYHEMINPVHSSDGYDYRESRVPGAGWSNHSGGVAVDINADKEGAQGTGWTQWWLTKRRNLKAQKIRKIYQIVTWGAWTEIAGPEGWSANYADAMHWELKKGTTVADVDRIIKLLGITPDGYRMNNANGKPRKKK